LRSKVSKMTFDYEVIFDFDATSAASGRKRRVGVLDVVTCDPAQPDPTIMIEVDMTSYLVDRGTFNRSCRLKLQGGRGGGLAHES
jgi:hypothetical protein